MCKRKVDMEFWSHVNQHLRRCSDRKRALQYWDNLFPTWHGTHVEDVYRPHVSLEIAPFNFCLDYPDLLFDEHGHAATVGAAWTYHLQICRLKMIDALTLVANARKTWKFLSQPRSFVQSECLNSGGGHCSLPSLVLLVGRGITRRDAAHLGSERLLACETLVFRDLIQLQSNPKLLAVTPTSLPIQYSTKGGVGWRQRFIHVHSDLFF